ncbi:hypothetical protein [Demequina sp.]|uniref:hypothetical protein n=1 Tax=Demequina sp. TaxID=2050685 RepID=UPI003D0F9B9B
MAEQERPDAGTGVPADAPVPAPTFRADNPEPQTITIPVVLPLNQHARVWMLLAGVLGIMLVAAVVIIGYLWNVNGKWQAQVTSLTATGYSLGDRIAEHEQQIQQLEATNQLLSDQLGTAKDKVLSLSNEKAQWSDETAYAQQQVDLLNGQVSTAQTVITQLGRCIDAEKQLATYVAAAEEYTPQQLDQYRASVDGLCAAAAAATTDFQNSLTP